MLEASTNVHALFQLHNNLHLQLLHRGNIGTLNMVLGIVSVIVT